MNRILVFSILQIVQFQYDCAAPIGTVQTDLVNASSPADNNMTTTWGDAASTTPNSQKVVGTLHSTLLEVQKQQDAAIEHESKETYLLTNEAEGKVSDTDLKSFHTSLPNATDQTNNEIFMQETTYSSSDLINSSTTTTHMEIPEITSIPTEEDHQRTPPILQQGVDSLISHALGVGNKFLADKFASNTTQTTASDVLEKEMTTNDSGTTEAPYANDAMQTAKTKFTHIQNLTNYANESYNEKLEKHNDLKDAPVINTITSTHKFDVGATTTSSTVREMEIKATGKPNFDANSFTSNNEHDHEVKTDNFTKFAYEYINITSALKQPLDYSVDQTTEKSFTEVMSNSTDDKLKVINLLTSDMPSKIDVNETRYIPAFRQAMDAFVEDVIEAGEKLGILAQNVTNIPVTTASTKLSAEDLNQESATAKEFHFQHEATETPENLTEISEYFPATTVFHENLQQEIIKIPMEVSKPSSTTLMQFSSTEITTETETTNEPSTEKYAKNIRSEEQTTEKQHEESSTFSTEEYFNGVLDATHSSNDNSNITQEKLFIKGKTEANLQKETIIKRIEGSENNYSPQTEDNQSNTAFVTQQPEIGSILGTTQVNDETELNKDEEDTTNEIPALSDDVMDNSSLISEQLDQQTSTSPTYRIPNSEVFEILEQNDSTIDTTKNNQFEFSTLSESFEFTMQPTTLLPVIETTTELPHFEEDLQSSVNILEKISHHSPDSMKKGFHKFNAFEAAKENLKQIPSSTENYLSLVTEDQKKSASMHPEQLHRSGVIRDAFPDNTVVENTNGNEFLQVQESSFNFENTTSTVLKNLALKLPPVENSKISQNVSLAQTGTGEENTGGMESATTEYIAETTTHASESPFETTTTVTKEDETTTVIDATEVATETAQSFNDTNLQYRGATEIHQLQTQSYLKQQQETESTTKTPLQIDSTETSEEIISTTISISIETDQQTTEVKTEVNSIASAVDEYETTLTPAEQDVRSLSLPPPKLEYLQSNEGVEVFYGYSNVKHN